MGLLNFRKKKENTLSASSVQTSPRVKHPYYQLSSYMPMNGESRVYAAVRDAVPIIDAALNKIARLAEGFHFETGNETLDARMNSYFNMINVGGNQKGIAAFVSNYLNQLLTFGTAVGEIVIGDGGIYALYNSELSELELKRADNGIDVDFFISNAGSISVFADIFVPLKTDNGRACDIFSRLCRCFGRYNVISVSAQRITVDMNTASYVMKTAFTFNDEIEVV